MEKKFYDLQFYELQLKTNTPLICGRQKYYRVLILACGWYKGTQDHFLAFQAFYYFPRGNLVLIGKLCCHPLASFSDMGRVTLCLCMTNAPGFDAKQLVYTS